MLEVSQVNIAAKGNVSLCMALVVLLLTAEPSDCCCSESGVCLVLSLSNADRSVGIFVSRCSSPLISKRLNLKSCQLHTVHAY